MAVRPSVRFDVFKRDEFTCQYCGRRVPDVTLEVDHIVPKAEGGGSEIENLATSCFDCNRGKGAIPLGTKREVESLEERTATLAEREKQIRAYHQVQEERRSRQDQQVEKILDYWYGAFYEGSYPREPSRPSLVRYLDILGPQEVMDAIDITRVKFTTPRWDAVRYFIGVCRRKYAELEGRVVSCSVCGKRIVLDPGEDTAGTWYHTACKEPEEDG